MSSRLLEPEWLDTLPEADERAARSRIDLQRLNRIMGHDRILLGLLRQTRWPVRCLIELGAGDGTLLLRLARQLAPRWGSVRVILVDRQRCVTSVTGEEFNRLGWPVEVITADVADALANLVRPQTDGVIVLANLFLHHFSQDTLRLLLKQGAQACARFVACEPRRSRLSLAASRLVGLLGCNGVTRHDAVASVRAGFSLRDLSALWPAGSAWDLQEGPAGMFSHVFAAERRP